MPYTPPVNWQNGDYIPAEAYNWLFNQVKNGAATDETVAPIVSNTTTSTYAAVQSAAHAALDSTIATKVDKGSLVINVTDHGIVADGSTVNDAAFDAMLNQAPEGSTIYFPPGNYLLDQPSPISKAFTFRGEGTLIKGPTSVSIWLWFKAHTDWSVSATDLNGASGRALMFYKITGAGGTAHDCTLNAPSSTTLQVLETNHVSIRSVTIEATRKGIFITGPCDDIDVADNAVRNWTDFAINSYSNANGRATNLRITGNRITDLVQGGSPRYPILLGNGGTAVGADRAIVTGNTIIGPGVPWDAATGPVGTADQISLQGATNSVVSNNVSVAGGDMGITVEDSKHCAVTGNIVDSPATAGIAIWGATTSTTVVGNSIKNAGQDSTGSASGRAGVRISQASSITVTGNTFSDDQGTKTTQYGVSMYSATDVDLGPNMNDGVATSLYFSEGANTNLRAVSMEAL